QIAERLLSDAQDDATRVQLLYERVLSRAANPEETKSVLEFVYATQADATVEKNHVKHSWALACHAVLASSRFQILE
ncbi:MAG: hypothetical protein AAF517_16300, partial [Planctomycetota bacterium]